MGTGKSTVSAIVAERLGWSVVDMDSVLHARFGPIPQQFERDGEQVFRRRERQLVDELGDGQSRVLSTGGGVFASRELRALLRRHYLLVTLNAPLAVLAGRVGQDANRPLWGPRMAALYDERTAQYADVDLIVDATMSPDAVAQEIIGWLTPQL